MAKRKSNGIQDGLRESTRVTKMAKNIVSKVFETVGEDVEEVPLAATAQITAQTTTATKKKGKGKAIGSDAIDLSCLPERVSSKWKVGAHVSAAGGVENAVLNAAKIGANAFALFLKSQRKWSSPPLSEASISSFKSRMKELSYSSKHVLPHGSYLINLGNPDAEKREKSYQCFLDDLQRCDLLGLELYNFHPGSTVGLADPSTSMTHIADCINRSHKDTPGSKVVVAGSGNVIGSDFAHLGEIINQVEDKSRVGVCLDTCHMFAAVSTLRCRDTIFVPKKDGIESFDSHVGLKYLRGMHLNDSKTQVGSKKDRHDNIGVGHLSIQSFALILTDPRMQDIPLVLETPSHEGSSKNWDVWIKEIEVLNALRKERNINGASNMNFDLLTRGIKDVIAAAGGTPGRKKPAKGATKGGRKMVEREQDSEVDSQSE
ncbi:xylose isomerase-like protein [Lentinula raphanica]|nr:xylose isomerase-like protein [Lentinula raphanica]